MTTTQTNGTKSQREAWLARATKRIIKKWAKLGVSVPSDVQLSCGFPGGGSPRKRIGECWPRARSANRVNQVFINPTLDDSEQVLNVLGHELLHAADDCASKHSGAFNRASAMVGYTGGRNSMAASIEAVKLIRRLVAQLGAYPHGAAILDGKKPKTNSGLHKFECGVGGEDVLYSTEANVEKHGQPMCRCHGEPMDHAQRKAKTVITTI